MKAVNLPAGSQRNSDVGLVWRQVFSGAGGFTFNGPVQGTIRVSSGAAALTVTIGGVLAATLRTGEVEYFNLGSGLSGDMKTPVVVIIGAGDARVSLAEELDPGRRTK